MVRLYMRWSASSITQTIGIAIRIEGLHEQDTGTTAIHLAHRAQPIVAEVLRRVPCAACLRGLRHKSETMQVVDGWLCYRRIRSINDGGGLHQHHRQRYRNVDEVNFEAEL